MKEKVNKIFRDFGKNIGIEELSLDENNYCCLFVEDVAVNIEFDEGTEQLFLCSTIAELPPQNERMALYDLLLDGNFCFRSTDGATIGVDTEHDLVALVKAVPLERISSSLLETMLVTFADLAKRWQERCRQLVESSPAHQEVMPTNTDIVRA
jgi:hypothetical protein